MSLPTIRGFDWDHGNRDKCQQHGMSIGEIEAVFTRPIVILPDRETASGERRLKAIGRTPAGRHAFIVIYLANRTRWQRAAAADQRAVHAQKGNREL
jgi:uncharacterized DUF497 family protein